MNDVSIAAWLADSAQARGFAHAMRVCAAKQRDSAVIDIENAKAYSDLVHRAKRYYEQWVTDRTELSAQAFAEQMLEEQQGV